MKIFFHLLAFLFISSNARAAIIAQFPFQFPVDANGISFCELTLEFLPTDSSEQVGKAAQNYFAAKAQLVSIISPLVHKALIKKFGADVELVYVGEYRYPPSALGQEWNNWLMQFTFYQRSVKTPPRYQMFDKENNPIPQPDEVVYQSASAYYEKSTGTLFIDVVDENTPQM